MSYSFRPHDPPGICARCGFKFHVSQLQKEWSGARVCRGPGTNDCYDVRNPQDFVRGIKDRQRVPGGAAPEPADVFAADPVLAIHALGIVPTGALTGVATFNAWLGKNADLVNILTPGSSWSDFFVNLNYQIGTQYGPTNIAAIWSFAFPTDKTLANVASGTENANYVTVAQTILAAAATGNIRVRIMWEKDYAAVFAWSAPGVETTWKAAWINIVNSMRSVSNRFVFDWCCAFNPVGIGYDPALNYPGDDYVDVIGMDVYYMHSQGPVAGQSNPTTAFTTMRDGAYGLQWQVDFAAAHSKNLAWSEFGTDYNDPTWLGLVKTWISAHNFAWTCYFDLNYGSYPVRLSDQDYALWDAGDAFVNNFGTSHRGARLVFGSSYNSAHLGNSATVTLTIASPCVVSLAAHGFVANDLVTFTTTGALPTGIVSGTTYYVLAGGLTANAFEIGATPGGTAINTTGSQSGIHTCTSSVITNTASATTFEAHYLYQVTALAAGQYEVQWEYAQVGANTKRFLSVFLSGSNQNAYIFLDGNAIDVSAGGKTADFTTPVFATTLYGTLCTSTLTITSGATDISLGMGPGVAASGSKVDFFNARIRAIS